MSTSTRAKIAARIKSMRKKCGYTQQVLADAADLEYKYIQRIEGKNPPNLGVETLEKIAKALKTSLSSLIKSAVK